MSQDCIFCRIVRGEVPSVRVYEDADVIAFMDIGPVVKGHTLVIPRAHHNPITDTPPEVLHKLISAVRLVARAQMKGLGADGISVSQANGPTAGQIVPHIHFHVIPRFSAGGHHGHWTPSQYENAQEMKDYADKIRQALIPG